LIVLDTHVWPWWENRTGQLTASQREIIEAENLSGTIGIRVISCWALSMLTMKGRVELGVNALTWMRTALDRPAVELVRLNPVIAVRAYSLPEPFHPDPADRLIVATAIENGCALITSDCRILDNRSVVTVH
jgi:PIN domain nuclease of toxin-antitoxin system